MENKTKTTMLLTALVSLSVQIADANLVPNPGFESFSACPVDDNSITDGYADNWSAPTLGTSDYFNACANSGEVLLGVPDNGPGSQTPFDGNGYAGLAAFGTIIGIEYREYIETPLSSPLVGGEEYTVSFYTSLAENSYFSIDSIGAYFSVGQVGLQSILTPLPFNPQINTPSGVFLDDVDNWMLVSGTFTAAGGEDYMVIGNFRDDASTNFSINGGLLQGAQTSYMYIDGVSVVAASAVVPIPSAVWLFSTGLMGLVGMSKFRRVRSTSASFR